MNHYNILSNAVKYTPVGGRIQMTVTQLPQKTKDFVRLRFEVQDNGIGMSEDFLHVIFEPFAREINSVTNQIQGTGLGMPITKNLVELMGGTIDVKSRQGEGSIFTVDLELRIQEQNVDEKFWENHGITRVLVVDDDESICINVIRVMEDTGVSVRYALGGDNAIRQIGEAHQEGIRFDLVLLDWKMPGMDGIQTARKIRDMLPEHIPILLLTAYEWDEIEEEALAAGIDGFLAKPFFLTSFKQAIVTVQAKEQKLPGTEDSDHILAGITILAAEDNELNAEILLELLNMSNVVCDLVSNGQELVEAFEKSEPGQYDLILTDIQMPVMNGYDAARAIRAGSHTRGKVIPIVAMTANAFAEDVKEAMDAGMDAHVAKPIDMKNLEAVITELVKKKY
ncbi:MULTISPECIES: response regulator [unclassified Blautia]|uniref:response regulator n=1 Tax=unclassified Blautia TaxID=2648079 RepID=UPI002ED5DAE2